jgi:hypothetical protein
MSRTNRILAIVSSIVLVLNYIEIQIGTYFLKESQILHDLDNGLFRIIYYTSFGIAFFYFARFFNSISERRIEKLIYLSIILALSSQFIKLFYVFAPSFLEVISSLIFLGSFIVMIIWGVKILKLKNSIDKNIKLIKIFWITLISVLTLSMIGTPILMFFHSIEYFNLLLLLYILPYTVLTVFFLKQEKK